MGMGMGVEKGLCRISSTGCELILDVLFFTAGGHRVGFVWDG